jgi:2-methylcitrate dehydratase PrpD
MDLTKITEGLGKQFVSAEMNIKPYACCASAHSAIDAVRQLIEKHKIIPSEVEKVFVKTASGVKLQCGFEYKPMSVLQAQMSLQYCMAVVLLEGQALLDQFNEGKISDPKILELAKRVEIVLDPEIEKIYPATFANKVEILLNNGKKFEARIDFPSGSPENPMSFDQVVGKFESLANKVVAKDRIDAIIESVERIEKLDDIRKLTRLLA